MVASVRVVCNEVNARIVDFSDGDFSWRLTSSDLTGLTLIPLLDGKYELIRIPVGSAEWCVKAYQSTVDGLVMLANQFLAHRAAFSEAFLSRFTEEEYAMFSAGLCCYVTEFGNGRGIIWCHESRDSRTVYCFDHMREVVDLYGNANFCIIPSPYRAS